MRARRSIATSTVPETQSPSIWEVLKRLPRPVWMIYLGMFINRFGTFVLPFLALHMTKEGYSAGQTSLAMGAYGVGHLLATLLGGYLADAIGRRNTIVVSMFSGALSLLALSQADTFIWFTGLAFMAGLTSELYRPASSALLTDLVADEDRVLAFAVFRFAINAGWAFGPATAGFLSGYSYFWLFVGDAITASLFGLIALVGLPSLRQRSGALAERLSLNPFSELAQGFRFALADFRFVRVLISNALIAVVFMQMLTTLGLDVKAHGFSEKTYGLILGLNGVIIVLCEIPLTAWTRRQPILPLMAAGNALVGMGIGLVAFAGTPISYSLAMVVFTVGEMAALPVSLAYVAGLAPEHMRGRYMGIYGLTWATAIMVGPSLGMLGFAWQPVFFWLGCGLLGAMAAGVLLIPDHVFRLAGWPKPIIAVGVSKC